MTEQETRRATVYRGQSDVARWCDIAPAAVSQWMRRHPDITPEPEAAITNEGSLLVIRGWLPERRPEWERFAADRLNEPTMAGRSAAGRARRTAELIRQGVEDGRIDPAEGVRLLSELI